MQSLQIEAMSCGTPIVCAHIPASGVSWVNQNEVSGLVVEAEDEVALANAIKRISTDANLQKKLSEGVKIVMKNILPEKDDREVLGYL